MVGVCMTAAFRTVPGFVRPRGRLRCDGVLRCDLGGDRLFAERISLPLDDGDGILGAIADTGAETVAINISDELRFTIDQFQCAFSACDYA